MTIKTYPNQKLWIDGSIRAKLKARITTFNHDKVTGKIAEYKQCSYSLHKAIKQAKRQYKDKVESKFNETYVARSTDNHGLQRENQPSRGQRHLATS